MVADFMKKFNKSLHMLLVEVSYDALDKLLAAANALPEDDELDLDALVATLKEQIKTSVHEMDKQSNGKGKKVKKVKDPKAPKAALSAYMFFTNDARAKVKKEHPDMKLTDVSKKMGEMWKAMSDAEKKPYVKKAEKDKERYEKEKKEYLSEQEE